MLRETAYVFLSNLAVNVATFATLALAPFFMSPDGFASLSLVVALAFLGTVVLDLGLNIGVVKKYAERKEAGFLSALLVTKGGFMGLSLLAAPLLFAGEQGAIVGVSVLAAAALNWWSGTRALEQARQDFVRFARSNAWFAALRLGLGAAALPTQDWRLVALAVLVAPALVLAVVEVGRLRPYLARPPGPIVRELRDYSAFTYLSSLFYNTVLYLPQLVVSRRLGAVEVGTFGLILLLLGPLSLINMSIRTYVLPRIVAGEITQGSLLADRRVRIGVLAITLALLIGVAIAAIALDALYGSRFPELSRLFAVYSGIYVLIAVIGPFNMEIHRLGAAWAEAAVNGLRLAVLALVLYAFGTTLARIVTLSVLVILAGEIVLFVVSRRVRPLAGT
jgi:O-antigen/teichoic acid export membrane protein